MMENFNDDIFVIGEYINSSKKEESLISLINEIKRYNIPILLAGHYPIKPEIQNMVDFYLFDKRNPVLSYMELQKYNVGHNLWTDTRDWKIEISINSTDYAVWSTIRNAVHFCNYLGKKNIHYIEYDNLPEYGQYLSEFLLPIQDHDAAVIDHSHIKKYITFIFSIKTEIALKIFNKIKTQDEYYLTMGSNLALENAFYYCLNDVTSNIYFSKYINNGELSHHQQYDKNLLTHFLVCDDNGKLYGNFYSDPNINEIIVEIEYNGNKKEYILNHPYLINNAPSQYVVEIGEYIIDNIVKIYYMGVEISNTKLTMEMNEYKKYNKITFKV